jgi:hypothetical protein
MQPAIYRAAPYMACRAPARTFPTALEALRFARDAANEHRTIYCVYEALAGRLRHLQTFRPAPAVA